MALECMCPTPPRPSDVDRLEGQHPRAAIYAELPRSDLACGTAGPPLPGRVRSRPALAPRSQMAALAVARAARECPFFCGVCTTFLVAAAVVAAHAAGAAPAAELGGAVAGLRFARAPAVTSAAHFVHGGADPGAASVQLRPLGSAAKFEGGSGSVSVVSSSGPPTGPSLFCFALIVPGSYEQDLLRMQFEKQVSIFACDEAAVYSNRTIDIAPGLRTSAADSDLTCRRGGEFKTALNTAIFQAAWKKVLIDGLFVNRDWTCKVDADAVFFPVRLRQILWAHAETPEGVYLNNCKFGLHGPLEVLSRNAIQAWGLGARRCEQHFERLCAGDCKWGEDMFIDQCLQKVLKARRDDVFNLLLEDHCDPPEGWRSCSDTSVVTFHPFKSLDAYATCLASARLADRAR